MLPSLGPQVAAAPFALRAVTYAALWTAHQMLVMLLVGAVLLVLERLGLVKKNTKEPSVPLSTMLAVDVEGFFFHYIMPGAVLAWYNPPTWGWWSYEFNFVALLWYLVPLMIVHDAVFFGLHLLGHVSKWAFNNVHGFHHQRRAILNVTTTAWDTWADGLTQSPPLAFAAWLAAHWGNWWMLFAYFHTFAIISVMGHCGYELALDDTVGAAFLAMNPFLIVTKLIGSSMTPMDHEWHHTDPRVNFSLYFTWWDEATGRAYPKHRRAFTPLLFFATTLGFFLPYSLYVELAAWRAPGLFWTTVALCYLAPAVPGWFYAQVRGAPSRWLSRLPVWDSIRRDLGVTYAAAGEPGSFPADASKRYIFCYQPWGIQARGAWYTFALKGRASPVAALRDCKLAASRVLWSLPVAQQIAALCGACDASFETLKSVLTAQEPQSVCVMPGGYAEARYAQSYQVVLARRRGFARLAKETGAALVPVIGVGEPYVCGAPAPDRLGLIFKSVLAYRPYPLKLVFGAPIEPQEGETADALHARYTAGLMALAKQHDVPLTVAE